MKKSNINPMPEYFDRYINLIADVELLEAFDKSSEQIEKLDIRLLNKIGDKVYAPGKWTINSIIQHIIDFERILSYRTLLFARRDGNIRQGVDENFIAVTASADNRTIEDLIEELRAIRLTTKLLFKSFDDRMLFAQGISWKYEISVLAMGFSIIGHQIHHFKIIEDKYFPLIQEN